MTELQMIFERRADGSIAPRMPRSGDGIPRQADGERFFTLEQAVAAFSMSEAALRALYEDTFSDLFPPENKPGGDGDGGSAATSAPVLSARLDLVRAVRFPHLNEHE